MITAAELLGAAPVPLAFPPRADVVRRMSDAAFRAERAEMSYEVALARLRAAQARFDRARDALEKAAGAEQAAYRRAEKAREIYNSHLNGRLAFDDDKHVPGPKVRTLGLTRAQWYWTRKKFASSLSVSGCIDVYWLDATKKITTRKVAPVKAIAPPLPDGALLIGRYEKPFSAAQFLNDLDRVVHTLHDDASKAKGTTP